MDLFLDISQFFSENLLLYWCCLCLALCTIKLDTKKYRANCFACAQLWRWLCAVFFVCSFLCLCPSDMGYAALNFRIRQQGIFYVILLRFHLKCNTFSTRIKTDNRKESARKRAFLTMSDE